MEVEESLKKQEDETKTKNEKELSQLKAKHSASLAEVETKYQELQRMHDKEVKELFENIGTLKFVKELRFFKG